MINPNRRGFDRRTMQYFPETWDIVRSAEAIVLMRQMAQYKRSAVEALDHLPTFVRLDEIVRRESSETQYRSFHNTVGKMCGSVMEYLGYEIDKDDQTTSSLSLFQIGAVYRWKGFET